jgi:hypothetical protein
VLGVLVVCFDPGHARDGESRRSVLSNVSFSEVGCEGHGTGSNLSGEKEDLMLLLLHKRVNDLLPDIYQ